MFARQVRLLVRVQSFADMAGIRCLDIGLLGPCRAGSGKDVGCAGLWNRVVVLVRMDPRIAAGLEVRRHGQGIAVGAQGRGESEVVRDAGIGRLDIGLLNPRVSLGNEDIDGTGAIDGIVRLVAIDARGAAALERSAHGQGHAIGAERNRIVADGRTAGSEIVAEPGIGRLDIGDLGDLRARRGAWGGILLGTRIGRAVHRRRRDLVRGSGTGRSQSKPQRQQQRRCFSSHLFGGSSRKISSPVSVMMTLAPFAPRDRRMPGAPFRRGSPSIVTLSPGLRISLCHPCSAISGGLLNSAIHRTGLPSSSSTSTASSA